MAGTLAAELLEGFEESADLGVRDHRPRIQHWATVIPTGAWAGGLAAALLIGAVAGLLPALRPACMSPSEALWSM